MTTPDPAALREALGDWTTDSPPPWQVKATVINAARWALDLLEGEMELHPAGSRVVTAEALVIERDGLGRWPREALRTLKEWQSDSMTSEGGILNALARASKAADV